MLMEESVHSQMHLCKTSQFPSLQRNKAIFHDFIARNFLVSLVENRICSFIDALLICSCWYVALMVSFLLPYWESDVIKK